jgi:hypothetical protein
MKKTKIAFALALASCALACQKTVDEHPDNNKPYTCAGTDVIAADVNNYSTWSDMKLPLIKVQPKTELSFDWGSVTEDFITHSLDAKKDLSLMMVLLFQLSLSDLETKLNADSLTQNDLVVSPPLTLRTNGSDTGAKLFDFDLNGTAVTPDMILKYFDADFYPPANYTYALAGETGNDIGQDIRMVQAFQLDPSSSNTDVTMTNSSIQLDWTANLHDLTPTGIPPGEPGITLDWGNMTTTALGTPFDPTQITRALVAHYNMGSGQIEKDFLDIELVATDLYETKVDYGTSVDFSSMTKADGSVFPGLDDTGTWLVALQCGMCRNPSPWYISILKPCQ